MKRLLPLLLALVIAISTAVPAYATGDGNMDSGGSGMGDGTKTNYWNPGMDGAGVYRLKRNALHRPMVRGAGTPQDFRSRAGCALDTGKQ